VAATAIVTSLAAGFPVRKVLATIGTGFIKNVMISFFLALFVSFLFVWFPDMFRP